MFYYKNRHHTLKKPMISFTATFFLFIEVEITPHLCPMKIDNTLFILSIGENIKGRKSESNKNMIEKSYKSIFYYLFLIYYHVSEFEFIIDILYITFCSVTFVWADIYLTTRKRSFSSSICRSKKTARDILSLKLLF